MEQSDRILLQKIWELLVDISEKMLESESACDTGNYKIVIYLIPIFGIVFGSSLLFAIFYWWHKQKIELIRAKMYKPMEFDIRVYSFFLGLLLTFTGLVLSIVFIAVLGNTLATLGGLIPLAIGLSLLTFYKLRK